MRPMLMLETKPKTRLGSFGARGLLLENGLPQERLGVNRPESSPVLRAMGEDRRWFIVTSKLLSSGASSERTTNRDSFM